MTSRHYILFSLLCCVCRLVNAQISYSEVPVNFQLLPRNSANVGTFTVSGKSKYAGYNQVHTSVVDIANSVIYEDKVTNLAADSTFTVVHQFPAGLKEYNLEIYARNASTEVLDKIVMRLVAGDCFMIYGQSNGMAPASFTDTNYSQSWLRGIGTNDDPDAFNAPCSAQPTNFAQASPVWLQYGFVGTWGLKLQRDLALQTGITNCVINGSKGGISIEQGLASRTPSSLQAIDSCIPYDRLYQKTARNHLEKAVKVLLWYQGETDAYFPTDTTCLYMQRFDKLYKSWKADYPNLEKIILLQVNTGCNDNNLGLLRDMQRRLGYLYSDVITMSTFSDDAGDRLDDNCHYTFSGYNKLAGKLLPLMKKYMYHYNLAEDSILAPRITKAYVSGIAQISLEFDGAVHIQASKTYTGGTEYLKDYFYGEASATLGLAGVSATANKVLLDFLPGVALPKRITYLPNSFNNAHTVLYTGPYVLNANNNAVAAMSFYNYPVTAQSDSSWQKAWSNYGSGLLAGQSINPRSVLCKGDFNGDGSDELLCMDADGKTMSLLSYSANAWQVLWTNATDLQAGSNLYKYRYNLLAADFNGDGRDELFGAGALNGHALFKFSNSSWQLIWSKEASDPLMNRFGYKLYAGDFDGNGTGELIGFNQNYAGGAAVLAYRNGDFVPGGWQPYPEHKILNCRNNLIAADVDGDGKTDLLGHDDANAYTLFVYRDNEWECAWNNNGSGIIGNFNFSEAAGDKLITGNADSDAGDELILLKNTQAGIMNFKEGDNWNRYRAAAAINDWQLDLAATGNARYYFLKTKGRPAPYLLALREENCNYLANVYSASAFVYQHSNLPNYNNACPRVPANNHDFTIYPNPVKDILTVKLYEKNQNTTVLVIDAQGKILQQVSNQQKEVVVLDIHGYEKGIYLIKINNAAGAFTKKVVVE